MKRLICMWLLTIFALAACGPGADSGGTSSDGIDAGAADNSYVVLGEDLQRLKDDFNSNEGRVRLMFLSGPTCGICLRGMADLNDAFIAESQNDDRLVTFVVHVPTLGAKEEHVADTIPLLNGPRVHHYWDETGIIGRHYTDVMEVDLYVWDFWAIYGPEARWEGTLPPVPEYYEHQLGGFLDRPGGFPRDLMLDAERFARVTNEYLEAVASRRYPKRAVIEQSDSELLADGTVIPVVAQPRNVAVSQHIRMRGGYKNLKRIQSVDMVGKLEVDGNLYHLTVSASRPDEVSRSISAGNTPSVARRLNDGEVQIDPQSERGLPAELERLLLESFEFDGLLVEWPDKGHEVSMSGMEKIGDVLAWKLKLLQSNGRRWHLFIDSHTGDLVKANTLDDEGRVKYSILSSNFSEVSGIRFPHRVSYVDAEGNVLGTYVIDAIEFNQDSFELSEESVSH